jgi:four helix bundle protein
MGDYRNLDVWQNSRRLAVQVYELTSTFPSTERFGLVNQMRRAAVSTASNIAEAHGRETPGERQHFLCIARGSLLELQTQALISGDLGFLSQEQGEAIVQSTVAVVRQLNGLIRHYRNSRG